MSVYSSSCIVRTNFYGWNKRDKFSLAEWMLDKLANNEELSAFKDVRFSPILVNDLTKVLFELYEKRVQGTIHIAGSESCSKLDFAYMLAEVFSCDKTRIKSISVRDLRLPVRRGENISLSVSKAEGILKAPLPKVMEGLEKMRKLQEEGYVEDLKYG